MTAHLPDGDGCLQPVLRPATANVFETTVEQLATAIRLGVFVARGAAAARARARRAARGRPQHAARGDRRAAREPARARPRAVAAVGRSSPTTPEPGSAQPPGSAARRGPARRARLPPGRRARSCVAGRDARSSPVTSGPGSSPPPRPCGRPATPTPTDRRRRFHLASRRLSALADGHRVRDAGAGRAARDAAGHPRAAACNIDHSNAQHRRRRRRDPRRRPGPARRAMEEHCDATSALLRGLLG